MFYLIGLGLGDADDITVKGLKIVKRAKRVYLESYTSVLTVGIEALEEFYGREVILADRDMVEQASDEMLSGADTDDIACLVVGDPFGATTHCDLLLRAKEKGIEYRVVHNASILTAVGACGLQTYVKLLLEKPRWKSEMFFILSVHEYCYCSSLTEFHKSLYSFGETVSICFWTDNWRPDSFYDKIISNKQRGLHTLCLLECCVSLLIDIKVKEQTVENLMRGRKIYEPPRYMTVSQAAAQLTEIVTDRRRATPECELLLDEDTVCVVVARVGTDTQLIRAGTLRQLTKTDFGKPLHSLVIPGYMHPLESDYLRQFAIDLEHFTMTVNSNVCL